MPQGIQNVSTISEDAATGDEGAVPGIGGGLRIGDLKNFRFRVRGSGLCNTGKRFLDPRERTTKDYDQIGRREF